MASRGRYRALKIVLGAVAVLLALLLGALQVVLNSSFLTRTVNRLAADYVDGDVSFGSIRASAVRSFPYLSLRLDDVSVTYPSDKFAAWDSLGMVNELRGAGRGETRDTLASLRGLGLRVNYMQALRGSIGIREVSLESPRVFAHKFDSVTANWNILRFLSPEEAEEESGSSPLPKVVFHEAGISGSPLVVFTDPADTLFAALSFRDLSFDGRLDISDLGRHRIGLSLDSLKAYGRLPADTLALSLDHLGIKENRKYTDIEASARALLALGGLGQFDLPIALSTKFSQNSPNEFSLRDLSLKAAMLDLVGEGDLALAPDSTYIRAEAAVRDCPVAEVIDYVGAALLPEAVKKLHTDARLSLTALCDGWYVPSRGALPELMAEALIPASSISYDGVPSAGRIALSLEADTDSYGHLDLTADELDLSFAGVRLGGSLAAEDLLGDDPLFNLDLKAGAELGDLSRYLPEGMSASGKVSAALAGFILSSDMDPYNFALADLEGYVRSDGIAFHDEPDTLSALLTKTDIRIEAFDSGLGRRLGVRGTVDSLFASYGPTMFIKGGGISLSAQNARETVSEEFGSEVHPIVGRLGASSLTVFGPDSLLLGMDRTSNSFKFSSRRQGEVTSPLLSLSSNNGGIFVRHSSGRAGIRGVRIGGSAVLGSNERALRRKHILDSLEKAHPGVPRDSLLRRRALVMPEDDFRGKDIDLRVTGALAQYVRDWTVSGTVAADSGLVMTPYFPLVNVLSGIDGSFDNDAIRLDGLSLRSGRSDLSANGSLTGLRRAMLGRGRLKLALDVKSGSLDANELLAAYDAGTRYVPEGLDLALSEAVSDSSYLASVASDTLSAEGSYSLLVLPSNLEASISLQGDEIKYSDLLVSWFASDIAMRNRTLQITNTVATSNMGDIYFEGFYATRSKQDITAGFDVNLVDITADKVITLVPAVDSIIPMLKSFKGMLDCEMAATSQLDTNMNLIAPSINGVMRIAGSDLSIEENGALRKLAKTLMFKDKRVGHIDDMSVQGLISNNTLEVFPFVLGVDRYTVAMSGIQNFDQSFRYHISVLRSPVPFRFGINLWGNFDDWKYRMGKARYKSANVPVFTAQLDTMQVNLVESIHNIFTRGVDLAVRKNTEDRDAIEQRKASLGYDAAGEMDPLSEEETKEMEAIENEQEEEAEASEEN